MVAVKDCRDIQIAYIGGASRGWAHNLMRDLAKEDEISGTVRLYDIDFEGAKKNEKIGNDLAKREDVKGKWLYKAYEHIEEALVGADFVIISILPGTFDEMESDVHAPEQYGIYQAVGDTVGPGGIVRALRTIPMFKEIALAVKEHCPNAWVINFTNPMTMCVRTLYKVFPEIKAFGCCHEVFGTQKLLASILDVEYGIIANREEIKTNIVGVNHFTFLTKAQYKNIDLFPVYRKFIETHPEGVKVSVEASHWANAPFKNRELVKFDLFKKYGYIAAAGDRHLAEFCPGNWYLHNPETVEKYGFALTPVSWRKKDLEGRLNNAKEYYEGTKEFPLTETGEETILQIKALLGLGDFVTNINIPNIGQISNNPLNAVVETNAFMSANGVQPLFAGDVPSNINPLITRIIEEQENVVDAALKGDYEKVFITFLNDPNVCLTEEKTRELFDKMLYNTRKYLPYYEQYIQNKTSK